MYEEHHRNKVVTTICLDSDVLSKARDMGINVSRASEDGIMAACHIEKPAPIKIDVVKTMKETLKPVMLQKMKRDIATFEKNGDIVPIKKWLRVIKVVSHVKAELEDMRAVTVDVILETLEYKKKFCNQCKEETQHETKKHVVAGMIRGIRNTCQKCLCYTIDSRG